MNITIVILAAGSSSRMGRSKQLLDVGGITLLRKVVTAATETTLPVIVVLGSGADKHLQSLENLNVKVIKNPTWEKGMGNSLKFGLQEAMLSRPDGVLVLVADQPNVTSIHLQKLVDQFSTSGNSVVASSYDNTVGVPALFAKSYFSKILQLNDNAGAKKLIEQNSAETAIVDFPGGGIDLDTPDDYKKYLKSKS